SVLTERNSAGSSSTPWWRAACTIAIRRGWTGPESSGPRVLRASGLLGAACLVRAVPAGTGSALFSVVTVGPSPGRSADAVAAGGLAPRRAVRFGTRHGSRGRPPAETAACAAYHAPAPAANTARPFWAIALNAMAPVNAQPHPFGGLSQLSTTLLRSWSS